MEESVLLGTKPLVDSIRHFIRDPNGVFSVSYLCECRIVQWRHDSRLLLLLNWFLHIIKRTLHVSSKIWILCSCGKNNISLVSLLLCPLNFNYSFFKALVTFCHCRALFSSVLWLKIIVSNVLYCCTLNLSRNNYFLANKNLLLYRCLSRGKNNILLTRSARS